MAFSEAWLAAYQSKRAVDKGVERGNEALSFTLPDKVVYRLKGGLGTTNPVPLLNEWQRMHWARRRKFQAALSAEIAKLIPHALGRQPWRAVTLTIVRYSVGTPDADAPVVKGLVDSLLVRSDTHPFGLGMVVDDSPEHLTLTVTAQRCATRAEQRTEVTIQPR